MEFYIFLICIAGYSLVSTSLIAFNHSALAKSHATLAGLNLKLGRDLTNLEDLVYKLEKKVK